jgi:hypothetical protein
VVHARLHLLNWHGREVLGELKAARPLTTRAAFASPLPCSFARQFNVAKDQYVTVAVTPFYQLDTFTLKILVRVSARC